MGLAWAQHGLGMGSAWAQHGLAWAPAKKWLAWIWAKPALNHGRRGHKKTEIPRWVRAILHLCLRSMEVSDEVMYMKL